MREEPHKENVGITNSSSSQIPSAGDVQTASTPGKFHNVSVCGGTGGFIVATKPFSRDHFIREQNHIKACRACRQMKNIQPSRSQIIADSQTPPTAEAHTAVLTLKPLATTATPVLSWKKMPTTNVTQLSSKPQRRNFFQ